MSNENAVRNLIRVEDKEKSTLFRALQLLTDDLYKINEAVFPATPVKEDDQTDTVSGTLGAVQNFVGIAYPDNLRLDWDILKGAFRYQIKMGDDWETAKYIISTASDVVNLDPIYLNLVYGVYTFIIRPMDINGVLGKETRAGLIISQIGPPDLSVEGIVSTVLLKWGEPRSTWRIDHYIVYKNSVEIGTIKGTFKLIQEQVGGIYSYSVAAVDIVGNIGQVSAVRTITLHDPSEFAFIASISAEYNGDYVNTQKVILDNITGVLGPLPNQLWHEHFEFYNFLTPQDQIDAGYPIYYQPALIGDGTYTEIFDFGSIYKNIKIVADYNKSQLFGTTNISIELSYSNDNITYTTPVIGDSILGSSFRYVKATWRFTNVDDKSQAFLSGLRVVLSVTLTLDSGSKDALATDAGGTLVTYNKIFTAINSVTATPALSLQPLYAVCDNVTKDNFRVLVFDSSGNRMSATINWKARGVV